MISQNVKIFVIFVPKIEHLYSVLEEFAKLISRTFIIRLLKKRWDGMVETYNATIDPLRSRCMPKNLHCV